jgi:orotidine-5'-phosphate decarboxylase
MNNFADRLIEAIRRKKTTAVVGLDPRPDLMPASIVARYSLAGSAAPALWARAVEEFCCRVLDVVAPLAPAVKMQSAFFELHGAPGIAALHAVTRKAQRLGLVAILDAKRGDIGSTCEAYADAAFRPTETAKPLTGLAGGLDADALTVNPYLGRDSLDPFLDFARRGDRGLFVLVRTSNPGSSDLQQLATIETGRLVYSHVAEWVREWSEATRGASGYGAVGAVVGGTAREQIAECRHAMPGAVLLIPGYGAQGAAAADIAAAFDERGLGAIVNSSRGILFPRGPANPRGDGAGRDWEACVEQALREMIADLAKHTPAGRLQTS